MTSIDSLCTQGRWQEARDVLMRQLASNGESAGILAKLSQVESSLGNYRVAADHAVRAATMRPQSIEILSDVLSQLRIFNNVRAFSTYLERLGPPSRMPIPVLLAAARQLSFLNLQERALEYVEEAFRGDPDYPPTLLALAQLSIYAGQPSRALNALRRVLQRAPEIPETYLLLSQLGKSARGDLDGVTIAEAQLARMDANAPARVNLDFALHRFHDDAGNHGRAFSHLSDGMRLKRKSLQYSNAKSLILVDLLKSLPKQREAHSAGSIEKQPIFIVGMHRSGTTLLEQLLSAHSEVKGIGELYDFTNAMRYEMDYHCRGVIDAALVKRILTSPPDYKAIGRRYLDGVKWRLGEESSFTDKLPSNFLNIGMIAQALPHAKILHMVRDPVETCFSNLRELFSEANPYSYDQVEMAEYYAMYRELMAHWHERFPGRIIDVDYGRLTGDTEGTMREVAMFCELEFEPGMVSTSSSRRSVATASSVQVRDGVVKREVPKWKPYEQQLQPLISHLHQAGVLAP